MDPIKKETVIQWLNKINSNFLIESLHNLKEGEPPTVLLNNMKDTSYDVNTKKECFEIIQKFIEDKCDHSLVEQVNFDKDDEVELAKIALLMLKVGLEGEHQEDFIKAALSLNEKSQLEIMSILKGILNGTSANLHIDKLNISKFLEAYDSENSSENDSQEDKATEQSSTASGSKELLDDASPNSNSVNASISSLQKRIPLLTSVGVENEENEQKNKLLRKLDGDLILEQHLRSEMEYDLEEKNKIILLKNDKIQELNNQIRDLKKLQDQLDECKHIKDQYDQLVADTDKLKSQSDELKSLKLENTLLINENAKVYEELNGMKAMKMQLKVAQLDRDKYLEELQLEQRKCFNLQMNLEYKQKVLDEAIHSKNNYQENLVKMTEKYEVLRISYEEKTIALQSEKQPTGESMNVITDLIATELKAELETIKTTWIAPDIHKQLKMELSKVISERNIFKSQWLKSREESLSMKFNKNLFQKDAIKVKSEHGTGQHQLLDEQLTLDILKEDLESFCVRDSNWQQTESIYKSELRHHQVKVTPVKSSLQNFAENSVHATETNISTDNTAHKELIKQFEELKRENQNVSEKLELETTNLKEITVLKSKLETVKQSAIEQESKLKGDFEELTKVYTSPLEKMYLETLKEVERINEQLCEKDKRIGELSNFLTEKSSLVEKYQNSNNELTQIVTNLKQNISEKETKTNLLKKELKEKSGIISDKDAKLNEITSIVEGMQQKVSEISQKHLSEIITLEEKHKDFKDVEAKLSQKEEELAKQQVEYDSVVAPSDKVYGQYETSVKTYQRSVSKPCNKVESQSRHIKYLQEQISEMKFKAKQEYNEMKRELSQRLSEKDEELKASKQEMIKIQNAYEKGITKCKSLEEHIKTLGSNHNIVITSLTESFQSEIKQLKEYYQMEFSRRETNRTDIEKLNEKQPTGESMSAITDHLMSELKTSWITPDIHEQLQIDLSKFASERDSLESKSLKLWEESLNLKSNNDLPKNETEIEHDNEWCQILDKQHTIEILKKDLESICMRKSNWQQTEANYKSELQHQLKVTQVKSSLQDFSNSPTKENSVVSFLHHCGGDTSNKSDYLQAQVTSQSVYLEETNQNLISQFKNAGESKTVLKNQFKDIVLEYKKLRDTLAEQEKALERYTIAKQSLEDTKVALENQLDCITIIKSQLGENTTIKKELTKQFEELKREKQNILEKLELETTNSKEIVTSFKSKIETVKQSAIEQESKLKGDFEELSKVYTSPLETRYLETLKEVERINEQLCKKDKRIGELSNFLTEKSSLVEKYQNSNNELKQIVTNLKQNISEKETKTNLLKRELEEKSGTISEKDAKLDELKSIVKERQQKVSEISQKHLSEIITLEEKHKDFKDVQTKLSQKEEELAKQQVEYDSVVAASDKLYGQYGTSVKTYEKLVSKLCNKVESQNRQIECLLEQMSDMKLKAEQEYNIMKRKLIQNDEEVKVSRQEVIKILSAFEEAIRKTKLLEEHQKMLKEKQPTERSMSVMTDHLMTKLMRELEEIKTTWIAPDIHEQLKIVLSKLTSERDLLESKWLKLQEDSLSLKSSNDLLKNEMEKMKIEHGNAQHQLLDKQHTIEKLQTDLKAICVRDSNWQQTGEKCKSELQHQQVKVTPLKSSTQNFVENIVHATKANISTENTAHKKELTKQFEETTDSTEVVTSFKSKLKPAKQSLIEQKSKLKGDFKEHSSLPLVKKYLETLKEVEQINEQLCEKDKRIGELSNFLTEKSSLVEKYQDSNNELTQIVTNLKQNISEKETKANLLKKELEEKSSIISEKDAKLDDLNSIVEGMQQKVLEISQKHLSEIEKLQEILKVEYEEKISSITSEYEYKISNDYVCKSLVEIQEKEHSKELETAKETLYQQYNQKSCCFIEEYQVKIKSQDEEHKEALQKVVVEFQEKISENYIAKEVFEAKLKDESIKYTQLEEKYIEKEKKLQLAFKEHEDKLAQVTLNYEEKIATDFVPQQIFQCEQEKHATALEKQEILYKEKIELLDEEHIIFINKKIIEFEDNITTNYVLKSDFEDVYAKLCQKEKEFSEQRAEYDLVVAASDKAKDQKKVIEMCNKIESQNRQIKCLQEQIADMTIKGEQEYNGIKRDLSEPEMVKIQNAYEEEIAKCKSLEEQIKVLKGNHNKVITALKETFQSEIKHLKESFLKEYDRRETIYKIDIRKLNDSHLQKLAFSQNKWKEIHQAQCTKISNYEKIVTEKELQVADIKQQLLSEKEARVEFGKYLASSKENHEEEIKKLNSIINETRETYQQLNKNNSMSEAYFHNREQKLMTDHTKTLSKAEERNTSLANCLQISNKELEIFKKKHENISAEIERLTKELMSIKQEKQDVVSKLQDYRVFYILFTAMLCSFLVVPIYS